MQFAKMPWLLLEAAIFITTAGFIIPRIWWWDSERACVDVVLAYSSTIMLFMTERATRLHHYDGPNISLIFSYLLWLTYSKCHSTLCLAYLLSPSCLDCSRKTGRRVTGSQPEPASIEEKLSRTDWTQISPEENSGLLRGHYLGTI